MNSVGAVIVASGYGGHGKKQNPMEEIDDLNIAAQIVVTFQRAGIKDIVVVCKEEKENLKKELRGFGVSFLYDTEDNEGEMFSSVKKGLSYLETRCERIFVCPVEIALFTKDTVEQLMKNPAKLVIPSVNYHAGHPILISASLVASILGYQGEKGLRGAIQSLSVKPAYEVVKDEGILVRADRQ